MRVLRRNFYQGLANELLSKFKRINNFTKHGPSIGTYHEEAFKAVLRNFLPERYSIKTGFIFKSDQEVSNQVDILIIDESESRSYLLKEGDFAIVRPECVIAVIEIKSKLNKDSFNESIRNIYSVRCIRKSIFGFIFGFEGTRFTPQNLHNWYRDIEIRDKFENYPLMILSLGSGRIDLRRKTDTSRKHWGHYYVKHDNRGSEKADNLSVFLQGVIKTIQLHDRREDNPFRFAVVQGQKWSIEYLRYGKGLVSP